MKRPILYLLALLVSGCAASRSGETLASAHYRVQLSVPAGEDASALLSVIQAVPHSGFEEMDRSAALSFGTAPRLYAFEVLNKGALEQFKARLVESGVVIARLQIEEVKP